MIDVKILDFQKSKTFCDSGSIMAVPKRKHSNARTGSRRAHDFLTPKQLTVCSQCSTTLPTHVVCPKCGYYMGRYVSPEKTTTDAKN